MKFLTRKISFIVIKSRSVAKARSRNLKGNRKPLEMMEMFPILAVVIVSQAHEFVNTP